MVVALMWLRTLATSVCIHYHLRGAGSHVLPIAKQRWPLSHMEKIETLIYLFVLQGALEASLLGSLGTPSHTFKSKSNSFYLGRGSDGFLIWRKYRNNTSLGTRNPKESLAKADLRELQA